MPASDSLRFLYLLAWSILGFVFLYYVTLLLILRPRRPVTPEVVRYEPPRNISPAVAAALRENGCYELAFVSALVSLAVKHSLLIQQDKDTFRLTRLPAHNDKLSPEEAVILDSLLSPHDGTYAFTSIEYSRLSSAFYGFSSFVDGLLEPDLISPHQPFWYVGIALSWMALIPIAGSIISIQNITSLASIAYCGVWILLAGSCLVAAARVWPLTFRKIWSYIPWDDRPSRPLDVTDAVPFILTGSALFGFIFLSVLSSTQFAFLLAVALL